LSAGQSGGFMRYWITCRAHYQHKEDTGAIQSFLLTKQDFLFLNESAIQNIKCKFLCQM